MDTILPLRDALSLRISQTPAAGTPYATTGVQRGLLLVDGSEELAEEAVGFGVPVLKRGLQTIFPGSVSLDLKRDGSAWYLTARFKLNLVEKLSRGGNRNLEGPWMYAAKNALAAAIRHWPVVRSPLTTASSKLRQMFDWQTTYADAGFVAEIEMTHSQQQPAEKIGVQIDASGLPPDVTEVVVMNEQGAHHFDHYWDSSGVRLRGEQIGCWDEVHASAATFENRLRRVGFGLGRVHGARLFRGRELVGSRLAWAGFGYSFAPSIQRLRYELAITRLP